MEVMSFEYTDLYEIDDQRNYVLVRNFSHDFMVAIPPQIAASSEDIKKHWLMKNEFFKQIDFFYRINKTYATNFDLAFFSNNYQTLKIKLMNDERAKRLDSRATYEVVGNIIYIRKKSSSLPHELYHLATSINRNGRGFSGFSQINYCTGQTIGDQINEGYTSIITKRYFAGTDSYFIQRAIMEIIEDIVGQDKMESLYSKANLWGLLNELKKHHLYNLFVRLMIDLDASFHFKSVQKGIESEEKLQKNNIAYYDNMYKVYEATIQIIIQDLKNKLQEGKISRENAKDLLTEKVYYLIPAFNKGWFRNEKKPFLSDEATTEYLNDGYNEMDIMVK